jgi:hypothetical protein
MTASLVLTLAALVCAACADGEYATVAGRAYDRGGVAGLAAGSSAETIRSTIGEPVSITRLKDGSEEWRFYWRGTRTSWVGHGRLKLKTGSGSAHAEAVLLLHEGKLQRVLKNTPWEYE